MVIDHSEIYEGVCGTMTEPVIVWDLETVPDLSAVARFFMTCPAPNQR